MKLNSLSAPKGQQLTVQDKAQCKIIIQFFAPYSVVEQKQFNFIGQLKEMVIKVKNTKTQNRFIPHSLNNSFTYSRIQLLIHHATQLSFLV